MNCAAVRPIRGRIMTMAVMAPENGPYRLRKYSGTVLTSAVRNLWAKKVRMTKAMPIAVTYHDALSPQAPNPFSTTPRELPPPISVAAKVPAINRGPSLRPATMKSSLEAIRVEDHQPMSNISSM